MEKLLQQLVLKEQALKSVGLHLVQVRLNMCSVLSPQILELTAHSLHPRAKLSNRKTEYFMQVEFHGQPLRMQDTTL